MKKVLVLLFVISGLSYALDFEIGKEFISGGFLKIDDTAASTQVDIKDTNGLYVEAYQGEVNVGGVPLTAGVGLRINNYVVSDTDKGVGTVATLYGIGRYEWELSSVRPYAQFRFGYPYVGEGDYILEYNDPTKTHGNDLAGIYYLSAGLGASVSFMDFSVNYEYNTYKLKSSGFSDENVTSGNIAFNVGVKF